MSIVYLFLTLHILGDFYFQSERMSDQKNRFYRFVIFHSLIYLATFLPALFLTGLKSLLLIGIMALSHFVIDTVKFIFMKHLKKEKIRTICFFVDQGLHFAIITFLSCFFIININTNSICLWLVKNIHYLLAFLLIGKPSNIIFKKVFSPFKPVETSECDNTKVLRNAGATIGTLERILIMICILGELYSSIGLILTAKSIARYDRISKEPTFSEYYLLGTLSSLLFTIVIYFLCFKLASDVNYWFI